MSYAAFFAIGAVYGAIFLIVWALVAINTSENDHD